jgi:hypothetical protein
MHPASPLLSIRRCSAASRLFPRRQLPDGTRLRGTPPGHCLRSCGYMAANKKRDQGKISQSEVSTLSGEPRPICRGCTAQSRLNCSTTGQASTSDPTPQVSVQRGEPQQELLQVRYEEGGRAVGGRVGPSVRSRSRSKLYSSPSWLTKTNPHFSATRREATLST